MHVTDICTIFGNALDNAIEYEVMIPDPGQRLIHVEVSRQKNFVLIKVSNYYNGRIQDGTTMQAGDISRREILPTTKADKDNHGYGLKSIRYTAQKYHGTMSLDVRNQWFELSVLLPMQV